MKSYLNNEGFSGGASADDGFRDVVALSSSLVVQHRSSDGCRPGKLNYPVAIEVVFPTQVLDSCTERLQSSHVHNTIKHTTDTSTTISPHSKSSYPGSCVWPLFL